MHNIMPWLDHLPGCDSGIVTDRARVADYLTMAATLEQRAARLRECARVSRAALMDKVASRWPTTTIEAARAAAPERATVVPLEVIADAALRAALRDFDHTAGPMDALRAFQAGHVIRQHNLCSTASAVEVADTVGRVIAWWNFAAVPVLDRLAG